MHYIVLYSKPGCHLCEDARRLLENLQRECALTFEEIDITTDHELFKKFFDKIPVLHIDQRIMLSAPISLSDVRAALNS
jgi:glutaredoxin